MSKATQRGFTLIELVVVIVILGILAAFAVPRFVNLENQARASAIKGLEGSIRSAASLTHALVLASNATGSVTVEGQTVNLTNGYPALDSIDEAVSSSGFDYDDATGVFIVDGHTNTTNCRVTYAPPTTANGAPSIVALTSNCN